MHSVLTEWMDVTSDKCEDLWTFLSLHRPYLLIGKIGTGGSINCYSLHGKQSGHTSRKLVRLTPLYLYILLTLVKTALAQGRSHYINTDQQGACDWVLCNSREEWDAQVASLKGKQRWELIHLCPIWQLCKQAFWVDELIPVTGAAGPERRKGVQVRLSACSHVELWVLRLVEWSMREWMESLLPTPGTQK